MSQLIQEFSGHEFNEYLFIFLIRFTNSIINRYSDIFGFTNFDDGKKKRPFLRISQWNNIFKDVSSNGDFSIDGSLNFFYSIRLKLVLNYQTSSVPILNIPILRNVTKAETKSLFMYVFIGTKLSEL